MEKPRPTFSGPKEEPKKQEVEQETYTGRSLDLPDTRSEYQRTIVTKRVMRIERNQSQRTPKGKDMDPKKRKMSVCY